MEHIVKSAVKVSKLGVELGIKGLSAEGSSNLYILL